MSDLQTQTDNFTASTTYKFTEGIVIIVAVLELLTAFVYYYFLGLLQAFRHPEPHVPKSKKRIIILCIIPFLRIFFVPVLLAFAPIYNVPSFFKWIYSSAFWVVTVWFTLFLVMPAVLMVVCVVFYGLGDSRLPSRYWHIPGKVFCILPVYNEELLRLIEGVDSLLKSQYSGVLECHIAFDSDEDSDLYRDLISWFVENGARNSMECYKGAPNTVSFFFRGGNVFVHRWPHGGKRLTQAKTMHFIRQYNIIDDPRNTYALWVDSDNVMNPHTIHNFVTCFNMHPEKEAFAGYMSCISSGQNGWNPMRIFQDTEYVTNEINRAFEVMLGNIICAPGGLAMYRFSCLLDVADIYFGDLPDRRLIDFHRNHLGEDRYLTHLLHQTLPPRSIGFCPSARCKTEPPTNLKQFIKQRRRWLLGAYSNDSYMLMDMRLWKKMPALLLYKCFQTAWRSTTVSQYFMLLNAMIGFLGMASSQYSTNIPSTVAPFCVAYAILVFLAVRLHRFKVIFIWPIMMLVWPLLQFCTDCYTMYSWWQRSWGGPRHAKNTPMDAVTIHGPSMLEDQTFEIDKKMRGGSSTSSLTLAPSFNESELSYSTITLVDIEKRVLLKPERVFLGSLGRS